MTRAARSLGVSALIALAPLTGCRARASAEGEPCKRSVECDPGLACVEGACSRDLAPLEDPDRVPMLTPDGMAGAPADEDAGGG